jgi:hypothetical protein
VAGMVESNYPGLEEQQKAHAYFSNKFKELGEEIGITSTVTVRNFFNSHPATEREIHH